MNKSYLTDFDKMLMNGGFQGNETVWNLEEIEMIVDLFASKGYIVACLSRLDSRAIRHDALIVNRYDAQVIMEFLFQKRINVEIGAEGREDVALIFVYNTHATTLLYNIKNLLPHRKERIV